MNRNCLKLTVSSSREYIIVQISEMAKGILRLHGALFGEIHAFVCIVYAGKGAVLSHTRRVCA